MDKQIKQLNLFEEQTVGHDYYKSALNLMADRIMNDLAKKPF